jgi:hypothetical protein
MGYALLVDGFDCKSQERGVQVSLFKRQFLSSRAQARPIDPFSHLDERIVMLEDSFDCGDETRNQGQFVFQLFLYPQEGGPFRRAWFVTEELFL